ncbi:MAG TPA: VWA domain-containing protein, partial [Vicinamibacteria bacterium]
PERARVSTNRDAGEAGRTFIVVFDDLNLTSLRAPAARAAVAEFLKEGVREGDRVLLAATGGGAFWSARMLEGRGEVLKQIERLEGRRRVDTEPDRMTDWEALRIHVYRDREVAARVGRRFQQYGVTPAADVERFEYRFNFEDPYLLQRASHVYLQALERHRLTLGLLERAMLALVPVPGRKSAILVSEGFIRDPTLPEFKRVVEASRRANVALHFVDARGLTGMPLATTAEFGPPLLPDDLSAMSLDAPLESEGSESLAAETGGFTIKNTNDLAEGVKRIARESESYYMLGYRPLASPADGRFHEIDVKVRRGGVRVRARRGYYALARSAAAEADGPDRRPDFQPALDSPFALGDIPMRMTALVFGEQEAGKADVLVATEVDVRGFAFEKRDGRLRDELQVLLVVAHRDSGEFSRYDQAVELAFPPAALESVAGSGYVVARPFPLPPGGYQAKIAVRDRNGGRIGTVMHDFEVPDLEGFRTSTPLLTDAVQGAPGERPRPVLRLGRRYSPDSTLYCEYEVYEAARDEAALPRVAAGYEIRRLDGAVVTRVDPTSIRPSSIGKVSRLVAVPLWRVPPGQYELVLHVEDQLAGRKIEVSEPFEVSPPSAP